MQRIEINPLTGMPEITAAAYGLAVRGLTNSDMTPSATAIVCGDLAGYGDDYFNGYFLQVITGRHELLTIDGAPAPADFAAPATLEGATSGETCEVVAKLTSTTYIVKERSGTFTDGEVISDGTNSIDCGAGYPTFAAGAAPEKQSRAVTDYVSATGTFTTAAFGQVVEPLSEVLLVHDSLIAIGTNDANNTFESAAVTANRDGSVLERTEFIIDALQGTQFRTERSAAGTVEENGIQQFTISLYDLDLGAIASADINITAITNVMSKSAGGAAFSSAGITQPTFAKANGIVACSYQFLAAEWAVGDIYRLVVEGITATVDTETVYCPTMVWSNAVLEAATIDTNVETILAELAGAAGVASFPGAADPGDGVSLAEVLRAVLTSMVGGDDFDGYTNISNTANASLNAIAQKFAAVLGIDAANAFNPSMFGAAPATVEAAFTALGMALGAEYDGTPNVYDTIVTGLDSSGVTNNFDGSILEVAKAGLEKTTLGAYDPDTDSNEAISGKVDDLDADLVAAKAVIDDIHADLVTAVGYIDTEVADLDADLVAAKVVIDDIHADLVTAAAYIDTEVGAIQAKTDLLPSDPADQSAVEAAITAAHAVTDGKVDGIALADYDDFDVADADANNERWDVGYLNGTEGGSADINTTTAGKLMAKVDPDATPTAAAYGAHLAQPVMSKYFSVVVDVDATFGTPSGSWATVGMRISPAAYDTNNVVYLQRQNSTAGVQNRLCAGAIFASANQGEVYFTTSDAAVAFKIERLDNVWRLYYSLTQYPNYAWVLLTQYEDAAEGMDSQQSVYLDAYSPGTDDAETAQGDFDNFKLYLNSAGLAQAVAGDYDSSAAAADEDGSVIERLEQLQEAVNRGTGSSLPADKSLYDGLTGGIDAVNRRAGNLQMKAATIDLHQAAASYDLFTGTTQDVVLEMLCFRVPNIDVSDDAAITSVSIQTDDTTPQVIFDSTAGAKANLTAEAQINWVGAILIKTGTKIQLTIAGGTADADPTTCDVVTQCRSVVSGGYLA